MLFHGSISSSGFAAPPLSQHALSQQALTGHRPKNAAGGWPRGAQSSQGDTPRKLSVATRGNECFNGNLYLAEMLSTGGKAKLGRRGGCWVGRGQAFPGEETAPARAWHLLVESGRLTDQVGRARAEAPGPLPSP